MEIVKNGPWIYYINDTSLFEREKVGKWMYFFYDIEFAANICEEAVKTKIVSEAKHSIEETGVACFYLNCDDLETHKKVIDFFIQHNLICKTTKGRYHNISFKLDRQTRSGEYGDGYIPWIQLDQFIDLNSGEWII